MVTSDCPQPPVPKAHFRGGYVALLAPTVLVRREGSRGYIGSPDSVQIWRADVSVGGWQAEGQQQNLGGQGLALLAAQHPQGQPSAQHCGDVRRRLGPPGGRLPCLLRGPRPATHARRCARCSESGKPSTRCYIWSFVLFTWYRGHCSLDHCTVPPGLQVRRAQADICDSQGRRLARYLVDACLWDFRRSSACARASRLSAAACRAHAEIASPDSAPDGRSAPAMHTFVR